VEILDLSKFPELAHLAMRYDCCGGRSFRITVDGRGLDLADVGSVWWRRPQPPQVNPSIVNPAHRAFAANETSEALTGLWYALDAFWVNEPARDIVAHRKAFQLRVAQDVGLRIPVTVITNDPDEARAFVDRRGYRNVVYKAFSATEQDWRETRILQTEELGLLDEVQHAPVIFQEYIEAEHDLRITVVDGHVFAAAIYSQETSYPVDFRMDMANARVEAVDLPDDVCDRLRALMARLGLVYGAIDMRQSLDGNHVFLEINPAGQWLFVEHKSGQPIAATLAEVLVANDRTRANDTAPGG
jgi:glutathione synthase/RimK-type ligase-like ATP-grasp enzyme